MALVEKFSIEVDAVLACDAAALMATGANQFGAKYCGSSAPSMFSLASSQSMQRPLEPVVIPDGDSVGSVVDARAQPGDASRESMKLLSDPADHELWKQVCREPVTRERTTEDVVDGEQDEQDEDDALEDTYVGNSTQQRLYREQQQKAKARNIKSSEAKELALEFVDPRFNGFEMKKWKPFDWEAHGIDVPVIGDQIALLPVARSLKRPFDCEKAAWRKMNWSQRIMLCFLHGFMRCGESNDNRMYKVRPPDVHACLPAHPAHPASRCAFDCAPLRAAFS